MDKTSLPVALLAVGAWGMQYGMPHHIYHIRESVATDKQHFLLDSE